MNEVRIHTGEWVTFVVNDHGNNWERETVTIDLLSLYSKNSEAKLGTTKARNYLMDGLKLTNEACINSETTFRFRKVGLEQFDSPSSWKTLGDVLNHMRDNKKAQERRKSLKADLILLIL